MSRSEKILDILGFDIEFEYQGIFQYPPILGAIIRGRAFI